MPAVQRFYQYVHDHIKYFFWIFFAGAFITAMRQLKDRDLLINETAPGGILSLELGGSYQRDTGIIRSWQPITVDSSHIASSGVVNRVDRLSTAQNDIYWDFGFILFYTGLGIVLIAWAQTKASFQDNKWTHVLVAAAVLAGSMDIIENLGMLSYIDAGLNETKQWPAWIIRTAALTKFIVLGLLLVYLVLILFICIRDLPQRFSEWIKNNLEKVYRYRVVFLGLLFFSLPLWFLGQGQDLLINSNAHKRGIFYLLLTISGAALLNWYLAKLFFDHRQVTKVYCFEEPILPDNQLAAEKRVSRMLGIATFLLPAGAVLNAMHDAGIPYLFNFISPTTITAILLLVFFALVKNNVAEKYISELILKGRKKNILRIYRAAILLLAVIIPLAWVLPEDANISSPSSLVYLFFHLVLMALAFYIFVSGRSRLLHAGWFGPRIGVTVFVISLAASVFFLLANIAPYLFLWTDPRYVTLPLLLTSIMAYIFVFTILTRWGQKIKVNIALFIILAGALVGAKTHSPYHSVNTAHYQPAPPPMEMGDYFRQWVLSRQTEIAQDTAYPVFLVNVYGGGIRGAAFTSMALTYLDSVMLSNNYWHNKAFSHYTFSLSGASGGTIGAAIHCAYRQKYLDDASAYHLDTFYRFYQHDFLTPVLITDLGRDVWAPASASSFWDDRAIVQERTWSMMSEKYLYGTNLTAPFCSLWDTRLKSRYEVPLLFSNTLNVDDGRKGICAPVKLDPEDFPATIFISKCLDNINAHRKLKDSQSLSLITAAFLSARFPIISPGGKMGPGFHFIDGGGKDNSGASTSEQIFIALAKYISRRPASDSDFVRIATRQLRYYFVSIDNSPRKKVDSRKLVENRFEPLSPLIGIVNSGIYGNAEAADSTVQYRYKSSAPPYMGMHTNYFTIYPTADPIKVGNMGGKYSNYTPVLPLGWQISPQALTRLQASFDDRHLDADNKIGIKAILQQWPH